MNPLRGPAPALVVLLVLLVLASGCLKSSNSPVPHGTESPLTNSAGPPTSSFSPNPPAPRSPSLNLTDCKGILSLLTVPTSSVSDDLPSNYTPVGYVTGTANIFLEMNKCNKVAVDGVDKGPADYAVLEVTVSDPSSGGAPPELDAFIYVFELRTNNPSLAEWFTAIGLNARSGNVTHSFTPIGPLPAESKTDLIDETGPVYRTHGFPDQAKLPDENHYRYLFGADAMSDYWDETLVWESSDGYPGELEMSADSELAKVLGAATPRAIEVVAMHSGSRLLIPSGA